MVQTVYPIAYTPDNIAKGQTNICETYILCVYSNL